MAGLTRSVSLVKRYDECGWTNISVRIHHPKLYFMHTVNNGMVPTYIADSFPPLVRAISGYSSEIILFFYTIHSNKCFNKIMNTIRTTLMKVTEQANNIICQS